MKSIHEPLGRRRFLLTLAWLPFSVGSRGLIPDPDGFRELSVKEMLAETIHLLEVASFRPELSEYRRRPARAELAEWLEPGDRERQARQIECTAAELLDHLLTSIGYTGPIPMEDEGLKRLTEEVRLWVTREKEIRFAVKTKPGT
jgi:hypothetical protein